MMTLIKCIQMRVYHPSIIIAFNQPNPLPSIKIVNMAYYIPPIAPYRNFLCLVLSFFQAYFNSSFEDILPSNLFDTVLKMEEVENLFNRIVLSKEDKLLKIKASDCLLLYTCFVCMNKVLVSSYDEDVVRRTVTTLPDGHIMKDFNSFRKHVLTSNDHLMGQAEKVFKVKKKLIAQRERLAAIEID